MNLLQDTTSLAQAICEKYLKEHDTAVDCTCGRGYDTRFLAGLCRKVYSFDIQQEAIESAERLLDDSGISWEAWEIRNEPIKQGERGRFGACAEAESQAKVTFINDSHVNMKNYVSEEPAVIIFNLGYLPGGDKSITTRKDTTATAVKEAVETVKAGGIVCITVYPGHEEGAAEKEELKRFAETLEKSRFHCVYADMLNQGHAAPEILWITRKK